MTKGCGQCGAPLSLPTGRGRSRKFCLDCSPATPLGAKRAWRERNRIAVNGRRRADYRPAPHPVRECRACGSSFAARVPSHVYCRPACRAKATRRPPGRRRDHAHYINRKVRDAVIARFGRRCYLCSRDVVAPTVPFTPESLTIDHVIPVSAGGTDDIDNLRAVHLACNVAKGDRLPTWWERAAAQAA